jgi:hypothetical protein
VSILSEEKCPPHDALLWITPVKRPVHAVSTHPRDTAQSLHGTPLGLVDTADVRSGLPERQYSHQA